MGTITTKRKIGGDFKDICVIIKTVVDQLIEICVREGIKFAVVETQGAKVHYSVHIFVGMLYEQLLHNNITIDFLSPRSFMKLDGTQKVPSKDLRASKVREEFKCDDKHMLHATDAAFLVLHYNKLGGRI